jgi:hypothetical protein
VETPGLLHDRDREPQCNHDERDHHHGEGGGGPPIGLL